MKRVRKKHDLDARVAAELGVGLKKVRDITSAFLDQLRGALVRMDEVQLEGLGRFHMVVTVGEMPTELLNTPNGKPKRKQQLRVRRKFRVHFAKAEAFDQLLRMMYGPGSEKKS